LGFGTILWALLPLLSLGLLAPVPFAVAAVRLRQRRMWLVTAAYAIGSALLIVGAVSPQGGRGDTLIGMVILVLMVAGTTHAFLLRSRVFAPSPRGTTMKPPRWGLLVASLGVLLVGVGLVVNSARFLGQMSCLVDHAAAVA
jgi:cytochrome c biogenesis factor